MSGKKIQKNILSSAMYPDDYLVNIVYNKKDNINYKLYCSTCGKWNGTHEYEIKMSIIRYKYTQTIARSNFQDTKKIVLPHFILNMPENS